MDRFVIVSIFIPKLRLILILNSFLGSSDSLVFSELFHSLAPRPLAARSANGRLHFHAVHFMRTLPTGSVDPNFGRRVRNRRQLNSLQNTWPYGYSMPIAVRYTQDAFSRSGWLWPVDAKGEPLKATSYMAVGFYVAKYVNKKSD